MKKYLLLFPLFALLTSCLSDDEEIDYTAWRTQNDEYVANAESLTENGERVYTKVTAPWAPNDFVLIKWHNDTLLTMNNLKPLSNSTINIKYEMEDVNGLALGDSYSNPDSIYQSMPNENITGMWIAMTNLHVGDSATLVIPSNSAYGVTQRGSIQPFSTLIYHIKLKKIVKYDK